MRYFLRNTELSIAYADGRSEQVQLSGDEVVSTMRDTFRIPLTAEDALELRAHFS